MNIRPRLGLIDYGSGNLRSVSKALEAAGAQVTRLEHGPITNGFDAIVLPGVGAFGDSVSQLRGRQLFDPLQKWLEDGRRFLGVCLGFQLLFEASEESPGVSGLGIFRGRVRKFPRTISPLTGTLSPSPSRIPGCVLRSLPGITGSYRSLAWPRLFPQCRRRQFQTSSARTHGNAHRRHRLSVRPG